MDSSSCVSLIRFKLKCCITFLSILTTPWSPLKEQAYISETGPSLIKAPISIDPLMDSSLYKRSDIFQSNPIPRSIPYNNDKKIGEKQKSS